MTKDLLSKSNKLPAYIFDIDGTLADGSHRLHHIQKTPKDWEAYLLATPEDKVIEDVKEILNILLPIDDIILCSGRSEVVRTETENWLAKHSIDYHALFMRKARDHRPDYMIKEQIYWRDIEPNWTIKGVFDDRNQVVSMWRRLGLRCYQVAPGNF